MDEGLLAGEQDGGKAADGRRVVAALLKRCGEGVADGGAGVARLLVRRIGVLEVRDEHVALAGIIALAQLLPEVLPDVLRERHEVLLASEVGRDLLGKGAALHEGAGAAFGTLRDLAQVTLHVGARGALGEVELAVGEVASSGLEVEDVQNGMLHLEHGHRLCVGLSASRGLSS